MIAVLIFNLPEEQEEFEMTRKAVDMNIALSDFSNWLRNEIKHKDNDEIVDEVLNRVRDRFYESLNDRGIEI